MYFWFCLILIILQLLSLWWPVLALRMRMGRARIIVKAKMDTIARHTAELRFTVVNSDEAEERKDSAEKLAQALEAYQDYQDLPLWPISRETLKTHLAQLWTVIAFLWIVYQEDKIWPIVRKFLKFLGSG